MGDRLVRHRPPTTWGVCEHDEHAARDGHRGNADAVARTPDGQQMDFVEVMDVDNGLIQCHRVYWGGRGMEILTGDGYHRR